MHQGIGFGKNCRLGHQLNRTPIVNRRNDGAIFLPLRRQIPCHLLQNETAHASSRIANLLTSSEGFHPCHVMDGRDDFARCEKLPKCGCGFTLLQEGLVQSAFEFRACVAQGAKLFEFFENFVKNQVVIPIGCLNHNTIDDAVPVRTIGEQRLDVRSNVCLVIRKTLIRWNVVHQMGK